MGEDEDDLARDAAADVFDEAHPNDGDAHVLRTDQGVDTAHFVGGSRLLTRTKTTMRRRVDPVCTLAASVIAIPMIVAILRLARLGHVYLGLDLALIDLRVRSALHLHEALGPYDRFGWNHPGPVYFYLLSAVHLVIGDGGRTEFIGAALINLAAVLGTIWVVRRHAGRWPALWAAVCLALLAFGETSITNDVNERSVAPIGVILSPWNPYVVFFPLILFGLLCVVGSTGSWASLIGAALVGTFTVQTDIATLPIVAVFLLAGLLSAALRTRRSDGVHWRTLALGAGLTAILWIPPIAQELSNKTGNFTRIWRFFSKHNGELSLATGLKLVLAADQYLWRFQNTSTLLIPASDAHSTLILVVVLLVILATTLLARRRKVPFATPLAMFSLLGLVVSAYAASRIYGQEFSYLLQWEIAVPALAVIGFGTALCYGEPRKYVRVTLGIVATGLLVVLSIQMAVLPVAHASDPDVANAWRVIAPHLPRQKETVFVTYIDGPFGQSDMLFGLVDEFERRGFDARVSNFWQAAIGPTYVTNRREPLSVVMYGETPRVEHMSGYIGKVGDVGIVMTRS